MAAAKTEFTAEELAKIWPKLKEEDPAVKAWHMRVQPQVFRKVLGDLQIPDLNPAPADYKEVLKKLQELAEGSERKSEKAPEENAGAANPKAAVGALFAGRAAAAPASAPAATPAAAPASAPASAPVDPGSTATAGDMAQRLITHAKALHAEDLAAIKEQNEFLKEQNEFLARIVRVLEDDASSLPQRPAASPAAAAGAEGAGGAGGKGGERRNRRLYGGARSRRLRRAFGTRKTRKSH
jgi:hypothetical protein